MATLLSGKVDEWFASNKLRVRRYAIPISIIGLFIACFLAYHDERTSHEDTKTKFSEYKDDHSGKGFGELDKELEQLKAEMHKWPTEGTSDSDGEWEGNTFVYREPLLILTKKVTWQDNLKPYVFIIDGEGSPEPGSFIYWRIDADRAKSKVKAIIDWAHGMEAKWKLNINRHADEFGDGIRLPNNRKLSLVTKLDKGTAPVIVRVYITSFEVEKK